MPKILDLQKMNNLQRDNDIKDVALRMSEARVRAKTDMIKLAEQMIREKDEEIKKLRAKVYSLSQPRVG